MGRTQTAEAPALHAAGKALTLGHALDIDHLAGDEVIGADRHADVEEGILRNAEFDDFRLGFDFGLAENCSLRLVDVLGLGLAGAELDGGVAIPIGLAAADDLDIFKLENRDRHVAPVRLEQAGHPHFLRDHASAHDPCSYRGPQPRLAMGVRPVKLCVPRLGHSRRRQDAGDAVQDAVKRPAVSLDPLQCLLRRCVDPESRIVRPNLVAVPAL